MRDLAKTKERMLKKHLAARGITNERVLDVFREVLREEFIPDRLRDLAYEDYPLAIDEGQTISQPYVVAFMTQLLDPKADDVVLEVGTGSGYQVAILSRLVKQVYTIERFEELGNTAREVLR
ncbi:MAG TPA: protein-L-isoaspartate O-methyltransferase, partial [candidate division WWE3 bacterium]|nr:protein-L-isoaspartate O-methyltransferase [candidate division WWE3 bacterium]